MHKPTKKPFWTDSCHQPSSISNELRRCRVVELHQCIDISSAADALLPSLIWACCKNEDLLRGTRIHYELQKRGFPEKTYSDALITMYAKCGELQKARAWLDMHNSSNIVPWTALIAGYARQRQGQNALNCFEQMHHEGIPPNATIYVCILKACALIKAIDKGKQIHDEISRQGLLKHNIVLGGALVDMYAKCGALPQAHSVLDILPSRNVVLWSALIAGYAQKGQGQQALQCFKHMQREGISPNVVTYLGVLKACATMGAIDKGKQIHDEILRQGLLEHHIVLGGALVDMYAKCGALPQAHSVLRKLPSKDVVSWNALIAGYTQMQQGQQALECFKHMQRESVSPDAVTYLGVLKACAMVGAIHKGKQIHDEIARQGLMEHKIVLGNALVDMYAKCGALPQAHNVLQKLPFRDVVSWSALIAGYTQKGQAEGAFNSFDQMCGEGILPDLVTFCCLLSLCNRLGLVEKGQELFDSMRATYSLKPDVDCFTCMVDLLGRSGHLVKAVELIQEMPCFANSAIWHCLLGACQKWVNVNVGTWAFQQAVELDKHDEAAYVLMANIYAAAGLPEKAKGIEAMRRKEQN